MLQFIRLIIFGNDINGLKNFYQSNFNLPVIEEIEGEWVVLNAGSIEIALHKIGLTYRDEASFRAESNVKLVFSVDNLANQRQELIKNGVKMKDIQFSAYCDGEDLEGNVFQLYQKTFH